MWDVIPPCKSWAGVVLCGYIFGDQSKHSKKNLTFPPTTNTYYIVRRHSRRSYTLNFWLVEKLQFDLLLNVRPRIQRCLGHRYIMHHASYSSFFSMGIKLPVLLIQRSCRKLFFTCFRWYCGFFRLACISISTYEPWHWFLAFIACSWQFASCLISLSFLYRRLLTHRHVLMYIDLNYWLSYTKTTRLPSTFIVFPSLFFCKRKRKSSLNWPW